MAPVFADQVLEDLGELPEGTAAENLAAFVADRKACAARVNKRSLVKLWLQDTGCGHDLVAKNEVSVLRDLFRKEDEDIIFSTASGKTPQIQQQVDIPMTELDETVAAYVLPTSTPAVMSVGYRL